MTILPENTLITQEKTDNDLKKIMDYVLSYAKTIGASDASVDVNYNHGFSVDVRKGDVETVAFNEDKSVSVTVYNGHQQGSASGSDTSIGALEAMVLAAYGIAKVSAADPCFGLPDRDLMTNQYVELDLFYPWELTPPEAIDLAIRCEREAFALDKRISNSDGVSVSTYSFCGGFATSQGANALLRSSRHQMSCSLIAQAGEAMQRDYEYTVARKSSQLLPVDVLAARAVHNATSRLGAKKISTQTVPVVFSSRVSSGLFSSFINAVSGSNLYRKNTFLLDSLGKAIFPKMIQVYEQPHLPNALGSAAFDNEGVPTRANRIVIDGCVNQYVLGSYSARKLGLKTTANAGGVFNLTVDATTGSLPTVLKLMDKGLLVTELMGSGVNILTGDYSRGASGFWVENGEIQYPVEGITIAGNLTDMYKSIAAVGSDINPNSATRCGSVLVESMMVSGN